ncbi:MAG: DUF1376 domain-containing protein [Bryobacteraceae bacterium]
MTEALPDPFVSADVDVRDLDGFMLNVERLLASELVAIGTPEECWAATMLWCRAWKQVPGGSLPDDDKILASFSGAGKRWPKIRQMALRGFVKCADGRLYHRFLCVEVGHAFERKMAFQRKREADAKRLNEWRKKQSQNADETRFNGGFETRCDMRFVAEGQGQGQGQGQGSKEEEGSVGFAIAQPTAAASAARDDSEPDPVKRMWAKGTRILGGNRALLGKLVREHGQVLVVEAIEATEANTPPDPIGYLLGCLRKRAKAEGGVSPFSSPGFA